MDPDLLRQRRNLLVTSLGLVAVQLAGATFKDEVAILGAGIKFEHPERLLLGAWVLWAYFLIRYFQYLQEEPDLGFRRGINAWIYRRYADGSEHGPSYEIEWNSWWHWKLFEVYGGSGEDAHYDYVGPKRPLVIAVGTVRAFLSVASRTPRFTDYLLPIVVSLLPVALRLWKWFAAG